MLIEAYMRAGDLACHCQCHLICSDPAVVECSKRIDTVDKSLLKACVVSVGNVRSLSVFKSYCSSILLVIIR